MTTTTTAAESAEAAVAAFSAYGARAISAIDAQRAALPADLPALLPELIARLDAQRTAAEANAAFLGTMLSELDLVPPAATPAGEDDALLRAVASARAATPEITAKALHAQLAAQPRWASLPLSAVKRACSKAAKQPAAEPGGEAAIAQQNVHAVLLQLRREWSDDGAAERAQSFGVLLDALERALPPGGDARPRVLVPGAGLGRLVYDAASRGYEALGVEPSFFMLVPAHFCLNKLLHASRDVTIFPFAHEAANVAEGAHLTREVRLPGAPGAQPRPPEPLPMRMAAAEWEHHCTEPQHAGAWDAVVACFFVDATPDLLRTLRLAHGVLKPGGLLLNLGPLLYHNSGAEVPRLAADELVTLVGRCGFEVLESRACVASYSQVPLSMVRSEYHCLHFVARKVGEVG